MLVVFSPGAEEQSVFQLLGVRIAVRVLKIGKGRKKRKIREGKRVKRLKTGWSLWRVERTYSKEMIDWNGDGVLNVDSKFRICSCAGQVSLKPHSSPRFDCN